MAAALVVGVALVDCRARRDSCTPETPVASTKGTTSPAIRSDGTGGAGLVADTPVVVNGINMDAAALTWSSADPSIATVDMSGRVHGVGVGATTISWQYDSRTSFVPIEVADPGILAEVLAGVLVLSPWVRRQAALRMSS